MSALRKALHALHRIVMTDSPVRRAVWYASAGTMAWMEITDGHHLYGVLIALLSIHYENMPGGE